MITTVWHRALLLGALVAGLLAAPSISLGTMVCYGPDHDEAPIVEKSHGCCPSEQAPADQPDRNAHDDCCSDCHLCPVAHVVLVVVPADGTSLQSPVSSALCAAPLASATGAGDSLLRPPCL